MFQISIIIIPDTKQVRWPDSIISIENIILKMCPIIIGTFALNACVCYDHQRIFRMICMFSFLMHNCHFPVVRENIMDHVPVAMTLLFIKGEQRSRNLILQFISWSNTHDCLIIFHFLFLTQSSFSSIYLIFNLKSYFSYFILFYFISIL